MSGMALAYCVLRDAPLRAAPQHDEVYAIPISRPPEEPRRGVSKEAHGDCSTRVRP